MADHSLDVVSVDNATRLYGLFNDFTVKSNMCRQRQELIPFEMPNKDIVRKSSVLLLVVRMVAKAK